MTGLTPLTCAIDVGSVDVVQYLLNNGADTEAPISTGLTPLVYAVGKGKGAFGSLMRRARLVSTGWLSWARSGTCKLLVFG